MSMASMTVMPRKSVQAVRPWPQVLLLLSGLLLWTVFMYQDTGLAMVNIWARSDTFAHAFFVLPISLWLIWRRRDRLLSCTPKADLSVLPYMGGIGFLWFLGTLAFVNALTQLSLVALLVLTVPALLGWHVTRIILFPLGFLFFSVPLGEFLMPQLMEWTANVTVFALRLTGVPVYREGLQFIISSGQWSVVEACSGIRYLLASMTVGALFSYLSFTSTKRRILFFSISIFVPVVANWMRAYFIVMLGHLSGNKLAAGIDHLIYGWIFFGVVIFFMFIIGARWSESESLKNNLLPLSSAPKADFSILKTVLVAITSATLIALPHWAFSAYDYSENKPTVTIHSPNTLSANWELDRARFPVFKPDFKNPTSEVNRLYSHHDLSVGLYLGFYKHQTDDRKLVSSSNVLVPSQDIHWTQVSAGTRSLGLGHRDISVKTAVLKPSLEQVGSNSERLLVWQLYWIGGLVTSNDFLAKAYAVLRRLSGREDDSAVIIIYTKDNKTEKTTQTLQSFLGDNYAAINSLLAMYGNN
jgi:exosortase A